MPTLDDYALLRPGELNPDLTTKTGTPVTRPSNIIDDPMATYGKALSNALGPDIFEGVNVMRGIILLVSANPDAEGLTRDEGKPVRFARVMIPELHFEKLNPFMARTLSKFIDISQTFYPLFSIAQTANSTDTPVGTGVEVLVTFRDPNKSFGEITFIDAETSTIDLNEEIFSEEGRSSRLSFVNGASSGGSSAGGGSSPAWDGVVDPSKVRKLSKEKVSQYLNTLNTSPVWCALPLKARLGMAANMAYESGGRADIAGDDPVAYKKRYGKSMAGEERAIPKPGDKSGRKYCSFGYFQLNLCGATAGGSLFIKRRAEELGITEEEYRSDPTRVYNDITNSRNQLDFVGNRMSEISKLDEIINNPSSTAGEIAEAITINFERPKHKEKQGAYRRKSMENFLADPNNAAAYPEACPENQSLT